MVLYHFFMTLLTLDSFLNFHVTIKYSIHCITKKLLKILSTSLAFAVIIALILIGLLQCKVIIHSWKFGFTVLFAMIILDTFLIIQVAVTHAYIFVVYEWQTKLRSILYNGRIKNDQFNFTVPTLVITTHVLLIVFSHLCPFSMMIMSE